MCLTKTKELARQPDSKLGAYGYVENHVEERIRRAKRRAKLERAMKGLNEEAKQQKDAPELLPRPSANARGKPNGISYSTIPMVAFVPTDATPR